MKNKEWLNFAEWCSDFFIHTQTGWIKKTDMSLDKMNDEKNYQTTKQLLDVWVEGGKESLPATVSALLKDRYGKSNKG